MDTATLASVLTKPGPYATVLVDVSQDTESGRHEHETRVRDACHELAAQGAPDDLVERLRARLDEQPERSAPAARLVVGTPAGIVYDAMAATRLDHPIATWSPLPDLGVWAAHRDAAVSFLLVLVDHEGGDITLWDSDVPEPEARAEAGGDVQYVHHVKPGDWGDYSMQRTTENVWRHNADQVAEAVERLVAEHGVPLVLVGGDPQSTGMLRSQLDGLQAELVVLPTGQRGDDGGEEALQRAIHASLLDHVTARRMALVHRLREGMGRGEGAATGVRDVADALVRGQVETLLVDETAAAELELDPAQHPGLEFGAASVDGPVRADEALIAAAVLTDAEVSALPSAALGGAPVAALLRWK